MQCFFSIYRYSLVFIHYGLSICFVMTIRPCVNRALEIRGHPASMPMYAALYLFPALTLIHGTMAGLICENSKFVKTNKPMI